MSSVLDEYHAYLDERAQRHDEGFDADLPDWLFDFQSSLVHTALQRARFALLTDCGTGKSPMQLAWADAVARHTNGRVLILAPLAVAAQTVREGQKFGIDVVKSAGTLHRITVTNYEKLHLFSPADFDGIVGDESQILKSFDGATCHAIIVFMRKIRYRLLCSATPAPNDYTELGTSSEALGYLGHMDMLKKFFVNDQNTCDTSNKFRHQSGHNRQMYRFKGHAEVPFWRWVCSWARAIRKPSDLGFDDSRFILPPLIETETIVDSSTAPDGYLFPVPAVGLKMQRDERRRTIVERCERAAELLADVDSGIAWCHLNVEGERLAKIIPGAVEVSGKDSDDEKESKLLAFCRGEARVLVTKPMLGGLGLNFQHCATMTFFPSHSFEQYYQCLRRCYRFGQTRPVTAHIVSTEGEQQVLRNLQRKAKAADLMFARLVSLMNDQLQVRRSQDFHAVTEIPSWLSSIK